MTQIDIIGEHYDEFPDIPPEAQYPARPTTFVMFYPFQPDGPSPGGVTDAKGFTLLGTAGPFTYDSGFPHGVVNYVLQVWTKQVPAGAFVEAPTTLGDRFATTVAMYALIGAKSPAVSLGVEDVAVASATSPTRDGGLLRCWFTKNPNGYDLIPPSGQTVETNDDFGMLVTSGLSDSAFTADARWTTDGTLLPVDWLLATVSVVPVPTVAPPARLFPRSDGLGVGSGRHFPPPKSQQRSGRRFGYY